MNKHCKQRNALWGSAGCGLPACVVVPGVLVAQEVKADRPQ